MARLAMLAVGAAMLVAAPSFAKEASVVGSVSHANPAATYESALVPSGGVTRNLAPCDPASEWQGFDGFWLDVAEHRGHDALVRPTLPWPPGYTVDFDVYFYDSSCRILSYRGMAQGYGGAFGFGAPEDGVVPLGASWAQVTLWSGPPDAEFVFEL